MAFRFNWPEFDYEFYNEAKSQLEAAMNKGNKPSVIVDHITVKELDMGTKPPELEILEIGELDKDKFRGIFKLTYSGDAYIEIQTKVQANPMHAKESELPRHCRPSVLAADQPLVVPMTMRISDLRLRGIVVLAVSQQKGVTLVFKNDPLESIRVSSTFDSVLILRDFLQRQIEAQLRNLLQEDLPTMIHNLSTRYIQDKKEEQERLRKTTSTRCSTPVSSLPELEQDYFSVSSASSGGGGVYTPLYFDDEFIPTEKTLTAANLFNHNKQYHLLGIYSTPQEDVDVISEVYATVIEGPQTLSPVNNRMITKLSALTSTHYTLSPLTESISNFTFRSSPQSKLTTKSHSRHKIPKRRITRLSVSAPCI